MKCLKYSFIFVLVLFSGSFAQNKGYLYLIGGGERPDFLMQKFIDLSGGTDSKIIIIPTASSEPIETAKSQIETFRRLGCSNVDYIYTDLISADTDSNLNKMQSAKAIFFMGGDQNLLTTALLNTRLLERIKTLYKEGGVVGGTSAGAAAMSKLMITGDENVNTDSSNAFSIIKRDNIETAEGLGLIDNVIVDQHFVSRKRHNRLITLVLENPKLLGIGIDESTACIFYPDKTMEVLGNNLVIIYDASESNITEDKHANLAADNIDMTILKSGDIYNLETQDVIIVK